MRKVTTTESEIVQFRQDVQTKLRQRVREAIETVLDEELAAALGCEAYQRCEGRRGYRNGSEQRPLTTEIGTRAIRVPRGRLRQDDGTTAEFRSELLPRYARRTKVIDEAILGIYLAGANSRRIRKALEPLLGTAHLSKSAVSRVVARLKALFESWNERDLSEERYAILYVDGFHLKVRLARRVVSVPVLAVLGVAEDGTKVLVSLRLAASEAPSHWSGVLLDLQRRGLVAPALLVVDGHSGLRKALESWPEVQVQRCTRHKLVNLIGRVRPGGPVNAIEPPGTSVRCIQRCTVQRRAGCLRADPVPQDRRSSRDGSERRCASRCLVAPLAPSPVVAAPPNFFAMLILESISIANREAVVACGSCRSRGRTNRVHRSLENLKNGFPTATTGPPRDLDQVALRP